MNTIEYIEGLELPAGGRFVVLPWEKKLLRGLEKTTGDAAISVACGNGKSALVGGIAAAVVDTKGGFSASNIDDTLNWRIDSMP